MDEGVNPLRMCFFKISADQLHCTTSFQVIAGSGSGLIFIFSLFVFLFLVSDISSGKLKFILDILWLIILHFEIHSAS